MYERSLASLHNPFFPSQGSMYDHTVPSRSRYNRKLRPYESDTILDVTPDTICGKSKLQRTRVSLSRCFGNVQPERFTVSSPTYKLNPINQTRAMRPNSLISKLNLIFACFPNNIHKRNGQQRNSDQDYINVSPSTSTASLAARTGGFTDPLIPTHPTIAYETATAFQVISGVTVFTTYTDLISGTVAIPFTGSTELNLSALPTTTFTSSAAATSLVFPVEPSVPPGSPSPTLDLGVCSTSTGDRGRACENSLIGSFNSVYQPKTTSGSGSGAGVLPTRTVTEPYLGAEVAKGEATWPVGAQASGGSRDLGQLDGIVCSLFVGLGGFAMAGMFW